MTGEIRGSAASERDPSAAESVVRSYWERVWLNRDLDALGELVADPVIRHNDEGTHSLSHAQLRKRLAGAFDAMKVCDVTMEAVTAEGSSVWVRLTLSGVSLANAAPIKVAWMAQYRIASGRIAELWALHAAGTGWSGP